MEVGYRFGVKLILGLKKLLNDIYVPMLNSLNSQMHMLKFALWY